MELAMIHYISKEQLITMTVSTPLTTVLQEERFTFPLVSIVLETQSLSEMGP